MVHQIRVLQLPAFLDRCACSGHYHAHLSHPSDLALHPAVGLLEAYFMEKLNQFSEIAENDDEVRTHLSALCALLCLGLDFPEGSLDMSDISHSLTRALQSTNWLRGCMAAGHS